jgi:hypothetical protein
MKLICSLLIGLASLLATGRLSSGEKQLELTDYQKLDRALAAKQIRPGLPAERMLDVCIPTSKRTLGRFTEYVFELMPGYHCTTILAKDGRLRRATEWSCTFVQRHFDDLPAADDAAFKKLCKANEHVPFEECIGRWGWRRPPMREWMPDKAGQGTTQKQK